MKTLISIQDEALKRLDVTRSSPLRYKRLRRSVYRWYMKEIEKHCGIVSTLANRYLGDKTWQDVIDVFTLNKLCEEAE